jgi:hypothetical protein
LTASSRIPRTLQEAKTLLGIARRRVKSARSRRARKRIATGADSAGNVPVFFVVGQQKSGTTWLMRMLDAHPEILCKGEGRFFGAEWRQKNLKDADVRRPASSLYNALLDAEYLRVWIERSVWSSDEPADEHLDNLARLAVDYFLKNELVKTGKKIVGDKSPLLTSGTVKEISRIYPEAKVIHIIRDGRDAAVSAVYHSQNFGRKNEATGFHHENSPQSQETGESMFTEDLLRKLASDWNERVERTVEEGPVLLGDNYLEVYYEDLLQKPEAEFGTLLEFLGATADAETVRCCVAAASFQKLSQGRKPGQEDATSFFRKGVAGDWRNVFTDWDKEVFKEEAGKLLIRLGYEHGEGW